MKEAKVGDKISCKGITVTIKEIIDQWTDRSMGTEFYCVEFRDTNGKYRMWKQYYDGGELIHAEH